MNVTYLEIEKKRDLGLFDLGGEREARDGHELDHPRLVVVAVVALEPEAREEPVQVVDGEDRRQGRERVMRVDLEDPLDGVAAAVGGAERRRCVLVFLFGEEREKLLVFPK